MMVNLHVSRVQIFHELPESVQEILVDLSFGNTGTMYHYAGKSCDKKPLLVWVVTESADDNLPVAWACLKKDRTRYDFHVYVADAYRGNGIASALVKRAYSWCRRRGAVMKVTPHDSQAIGFYKKFTGRKFIYDTWYGQPLHRHLKEIARIRCD